MEEQKKIQRFYEKNHLHALGPPITHTFSAEGALLLCSQCLHSFLWASTPWLRLVHWHHHTKLYPSFLCSPHGPSPAQIPRVICMTLNAAFPQTPLQLPTQTRMCSLSQLPVLGPSSAGKPLSGQRPSFLSPLSLHVCTLHFFFLRFKWAPIRAAERSLLGLQRGPC